MSIDTIDTKALRDGAAFARNFAMSKPDIGRMEQEHIIGLVNLLERAATAADQSADRLAALEEQAAMGRALQRYLDDVGRLLESGEDQDYRERAREVIDRLAALEEENGQLRDLLIDHIVPWYDGHHAHPGKSLYVCDLCDAGHWDSPERVKHADNCVLAANGGAG